MDKAAFRNKFRILNPNGSVLRLNTTEDKHGVSRYVEGFKTQQEAQAAINLFCLASGLKDTSLFRIETYAEPLLLHVPIVNDQMINRELERRRFFSGKGLKFNSDIPKKEERKYSSAKFYTREIWLSQSVERNKGTSINKKFRHKPKQHIGLCDTTIMNMPSYQPNGFTNSLLESLKRKGFTNRKELKDYLKPLGFSNSHINRIQSDLIHAI